MKYFKAINKEDPEDILYLSSNIDLDEARTVEEILRIGNYGYDLVPCSEAEFETMTQEENDYIIYVGNTADDLTPIDSASTYEEGVKKGETYLDEDWKYAELVYMPCDEDDTNVIVWFKNK